MLPLLLVPQIGVRETKSRPKGRRPCCEKEGLNKGGWTAMEDTILANYIALHGEGKWRDLPRHAGLKRCGKSCRLRWLNYLTPKIKRGNITLDEEDLIIRLHKLLGNSAFSQTKHKLSQFLAHILWIFTYELRLGFHCRWSLIAGRLPGRTDNEIKNYWNCKLGKWVRSHRGTHQLHFDEENKLAPPSSDPKPLSVTCVVHPKATRCTKVVISQEIQNIQPKKINVYNCENLTSQGILSKVLEDEFSLFSNLHQEGEDEPIISPFSNDNVFKMNEDDVHGDMDEDWIASLLQSDFVLKTCD